jgi:hypothetical protein
MNASDYQRPIVATRPGMVLPRTHRRGTPLTRTAAGRKPNWRASFRASNDIPGPRIYSGHLQLLTVESIRRGVLLHGRDGGHPNVDINELPACDLRVRAVVRSERQGYQPNSRATILHDASNGNPCTVLEWPKIDALSVTFVPLRVSLFALGMAVEGS